MVWYHSSLASTVHSPHTGLVIPRPTHSKPTRDEVVLSGPTRSAIKRNRPCQNQMIFTRTSIYLAMTKIVLSKPLSSGQGPLWSWQNHDGPGKTILVLARPVWSWHDHYGPGKPIICLGKATMVLAKRSCSWQDHCGPRQDHCGSWQDHYGPGKTIVVLAGSQLAIMARPGHTTRNYSPARTTTGKLWSGQDHNWQLWSDYSPGRTTTGKLWSGQDHNWQLWSGQDHNWQVWSGQDHNWQLWSGQDTQLASCGPVRTTSTKEVKTQTSMVMHTSFGLF